MSSSPESEVASGALLDGDAVQDALEQFDTLVDLDRRMEDAAAAADQRADDAPRDATAPRRTVADTAPPTEVATAELPHASSREPKVERATTLELVPASEARFSPQVDVTEIARRVETSLVDQGPLAADALRPKLVPRSAEPELVGIDGAELAWADDPSGSSRPILGAVVIAVLLLGAAGVVFAPQWLERGAPAAAPLADIDPIAYRAPKQVASQLAIAPPRAGGVAGEPLPPLPAAAAPQAGPALLASAVAPPPALRRAATAPVQNATAGNAPSPSAAPPAARSAAPSALRSAGSRPRTRGRIEPTFTAEDALEQDGPRIVLRVLVDERGAPVRVMVEEGVPGSAGVSKAIDAVLRTRYEAGRRQGEPVRAWLLETFDLPAGE